MIGAWQTSIDRKGPRGLHLVCKNEAAHNGHHHFGGIEIEQLQTLSLGNVAFLV